MCALRTCFCLEPASEWKALGLEADPSKGALRPAMAAAAAVAAAGRAGRMPPTAVAADWLPFRIATAAGRLPPAAVAAEPTAGVVVQIPACTTSPMFTSPAALCPAGIQSTV